jgi:hypothetical protein
LWVIPIHEILGVYSFPIKQSYIVALAKDKEKDSNGDLAATWQRVGGLSTDVATWHSLSKALTS